MVKEKPKVIAVIQARFNSERLPGKVLIDIGGKTLLHRVIDSVKASNRIDEVWVATTTLPADKAIVQEAKELGVLVFRGSEKDVLSRFLEIYNISKPNYIIRITSDNPFTYYAFIDQLVNKISNNRLDYVSINRNPLGTGVEVFSKDALDIISQYSLDASDKEHVTLFIKKRKDLFKTLILDTAASLRKPELRLTIDTLEDLMLANAIIYFLGEGCSNLHKIIELIEQQPWLYYINNNVQQRVAHTVD